MRVNEDNPLGSEKIVRLLHDFALPSIIAMLVGALYNIVDQFFIGRSVGMYGNAATNVALPLTTVCTALGLLFGVGGASNFNLKMGAGKREEAAKYIGNSITLLVGSGVALAVFVLVFLKPLMIAFGATDIVLKYALIFAGINCLGFPFLILGTGGSTLVRADGSPKYSMTCNADRRFYQSDPESVICLCHGLGHCRLSLCYCYRTGYFRTDGGRLSAKI